MTLGSGPTFGLRSLLGEAAAELDGEAPLERAVMVHGDVTRLAAFTSLPELSSPSAIMLAYDGTPKLARAWSPGGVAAFELLATREQLPTLYEAGFTIVLEDVESYVPALRPLCRQLEIDLGVDAGLVNVEAFFSKRGGHGRPHFDPSFTFNCQVSGTKTWRVSRNEAFPFPPVGMFLGRPVDDDVRDLLASPLPNAIEEGEPFEARPGSVVFLPPGVLHETRAEGPTFAIAFAIEHVDRVSDHVATRVRRELRRCASLRAPRLGAQTRSFAQHARHAAAELRRLADDLEREAAPWWGENAARARLRLRDGLRAEARDETTVVLRSERRTRELTLQPTMVKILVWGSTRTDAFTVRDIVRVLDCEDPALAAGCVRQLVHAGLMEEVQ